MSKLSTAAWIAHDLGLAASIGGALFGRVALDPALKQISDPAERDQVNEAAWGRYGKVSLISHLAIAASWLVGRTMLSGREVSASARSLTRAKDVLVGVSVASVAGSAILGALLSRERGEPGPEEARARGANGKGRGEAHEKVAIDRTLDVIGLVNLGANIALAGVTAALAAEGNRSARFALVSRFLP